MKIFIIITMLILNGLMSDSISIVPTIINDTIIDSTGERFKNDFREAILEFATEDMPADSLYFPEFLKK